MFYESWFNLSETPFSISPDPRYLYLTPGHREALAHLLYGVSANGGFVLLTGEIGAGKTTVCRCLLEQLPEDVDVALILNPKLEAKEFLQAICDELGLSLYDDKEITLKLLVDSIHSYLLEAHSKGRNTVLIVDEAQNLSPDVLEHLRLLTNLETSERKLMQIMLIGQPELRDLVASPMLRQMAQRITARFHLDVLSLPETLGYIRHRLKVAGCTAPLFDKNSAKYIWKSSRGVPRLINAICDRALLGARVGSKRQVTLDIARRAAEEVLGKENLSRGFKQALLAKSSFYARAFATILLLCLVGAGIVSIYSRLDVSLFSPGAMQANPLADSALASDSEKARLDLREPSIGKSPLTHRQISVPERDVTSTETTAIKEAENITFAVRLARQAPEAWPESSLLAQRHLFRLWGKEYVPAEHQSVCDFAQSQGLACLLDEGDIHELISLNRPAVLTLRNHYGSRFHAAIVALSKQYAEINFFGQLYRVSIDELVSLWDGHYLLFWRVPYGYRGILRQGSRGDVVNWVAEVLAVGNSGVYSGYYDKEMAYRVALFQNSHGLVPDGEVGPRTIIALNTFANLKVPKLVNSAIQ